VEHPWKSALVTGASSGIGEALARQLARGGVDLVLVARRADRLTQLADGLVADHGVAVETIAADLTDPTDLARVADRLADADRPIELLVNNAGAGISGRFVDNDLADDRQTIDLNIRAVVELSHAGLTTMLRRNRGWLVNVSSLGGHAPGPSFAVYSATKAFVTSFSESLHEEVRGTGVSVTVVCPGATRTEFGEHAGNNADHLPDLLFQTADEVATEALVAAAAGKAVRVTGLVNRISAAFTTVLPRAANRRLSAMVTDRL
jgi:short-subunit dehydrogenase